MFDQEHYLRSWEDLNFSLQQVESDHGNLARVLDELYKHQLLTGFVRDDLSEIERTAMADPADNANVFFVQYNPARELRLTNVGRTLAPPGFHVVHDGCYLCRDNVLWQQEGAELGYELALNGRTYIAWMNPYPLAPAHAIIASQLHQPQGWALDKTDINRLQPQELLADLLELSGRLPGYICFYNGEDAGASNPRHLHYHAMRRLPGSGPFPLERQARSTGSAEGVFTNGYPVHFAFWRGGEAELAAEAGKWMQDWLENNSDHKDELSANIITSCDDDSGEISLYIVPRLKAGAANTSPRPGIGCLELLGEMVFSTEEEKNRLDNGEIDYHTLEKILATVCFPLD